jgi:transcriptional regulator with XRE-family HTH domain
MTNKNWVKDNEKEAILDIAGRITTRRNELDINQRDLADLVGTTQTSIRRLEGGETNVSAVLLVRAAKALDMEVEDLLAPIKPELQLVGEVYRDNRDEVEKSTSAMGLTEEDMDNFHTQRDLLRLMKLWPR